MTGPCERIRLSLGVHALGALDPEERAEVEAHLAECKACRAEYEELAALPALLAKVSPDDIAHAVQPPRAVLDRLLATRAKRRRRARLVLVAAASAAVLAAGGGVGTALLTQDLGETAVSARADQQSVPSAAGGEEDAHALRDDTAGPAEDMEAVRESADPAEQAGKPRPQSSAPAESAPAESPRPVMAAPDRQAAAEEGGVAARVLLYAGENGTTVAFTLTGVPSGTYGRLVAVGEDGSAETVMSWRSVADASRGTTFTGTIGFPPDRIDRFEVVTSDGEVLVHVPVER